MFRARPDLLLPFAVVAFYRFLKAVRADWRKDRHHARTQADPNNAAARIGVLVRAGEAGVIVELRMVGQADPAPVPQHGC